jgi:hypothetical protein
MVNLSKIGRLFFGIGIAVMGLPTIFYKVFPYMLLPPRFLTPGHPMLTFISGALLFLTGISIVFEKKTRQVSFLFGIVLVLIFCLLFIPYMFSAKSNFMHLTEWENAEKELALAGGAFVIAGCFSGKNKNELKSFWGNLVSIGAVLYSIPIVSFGILHFMYGKDVASMVPSWIPYHLFWIYFAGAALIGSGVAIILKIRTRLIAALLGSMIFIWFIILHMPGVIDSSSADMSGEVTSAFIALAYSGTAFVIAGNSKKKARM